MDDTVDGIKADIDRTRERLGSNLTELDAKVQTAIDWRQHYRDKPHLFLGAAVVSGAVLATTLRSKSPRGRGRDNVTPLGAGSAATAHARALWGRMAGALVGIAEARIKSYIGEFVPGFEEHYQRAAQGASGASWEDSGWKPA